VSKFEDDHIEVEYYDYLHRLVLAWYAKRTPQHDTRQLSLPITLPPKRGMSETTGVVLSLFGHDS
jgi:hypothetical protein